MSDQICHLAFGQIAEGGLAKVGWKVGEFAAGISCGWMTGCVGRHADG